MIEKLQDSTPNFGHRYRKLIAGAVGFAALSTGISACGGSGSSKELAVPIHGKFSPVYCGAVAAAEHYNPGLSTSAGVSANKTYESAEKSMCETANAIAGEFVSYYKKHDQAYAEIDDAQYVNGSSNAFGVAMDNFTLETTSGDTIQVGFGLDNNGNADPTQLVEAAVTNVKTGNYAEVDYDQNGMWSISSTINTPSMYWPAPSINIRSNSPDGFTFNQNQQIYGQETPALLHNLKNLSFSSTNTSVNQAYRTDGNSGNS